MTSRSCYSGAFDLNEAAASDPAAPKQPIIVQPPPSCLPPSSPLPPSDSATEGLTAVEVDEEGLAEDQAASGPGRLLYIQSARLQQLGQLLPVNRRRSTLVHSLMQATGLLESAEVLEAQPASIEQLREYHTLEYLAALAHYQKLKEGRLAEVGLADDCQPFPGLYEFAALVAGGSLQGAGALAAGRCRTAVHFDGGRHHAHKSRAAGFCYVNDVVLAILHLLGSFPRVMYIDLDVHHCDAVEEAFYMTDRVVTVSLHKWAPGFFPGTGSLRNTGEGRGRGFSLNLPLGDGLRDALFVDSFRVLAGGAVELYRPDCVVLQCGVDGMAHDPLAASWGLTPRGYAACAAEAARWGLPLLVLGGGGYEDSAAARAWAAVLAALLGQELPDNVPDHEHLDAYGPNFQIFTGPKPMLAPDTNDPQAVAAKCQQLLCTLRGALQKGSAAEGAPAPKRARAS